MTKLKQVGNIPNTQPWMFTLVNKESLQVTRILALGRSANIAELHVRNVFSDIDWSIDSTMMISNKKFLCNADYTFPNVNLDF